MRSNEVHTSKLYLDEKRRKSWVDGKGVDMRGVGRMRLSVMKTHCMNSQRANKTFKNHERSGLLQLMGVSIVLPPVFACHRVLAFQFYIAVEYGLH